MELDHALIQRFLSSHPHSLFFVTMSGAHLYGFASRDSDYDLRGAHVAALERVVSLRPPPETHDLLDRGAPIEIDLVTHDIGKFIRMLLNRNGYALEQVCSPLVIRGGAGFEELRALAMRCLTKFHHYHFDSFARSQWSQIAGPSRGTVKGMLYTYRPLLAGIHLMSERRVESNLRVLNERFRLGYIDELIARKVQGSEKAPLGDEAMEFHEAEFARLREALREASEASGLPTHPPPQVRDAFDDLLVRTRVATRELGLA